MKKLRLKKISGFTLVEVLVSLFVFSLMMIVASRIFASAFEGYRYTRSVQRDAEAAQFALNILVKELRTSSIVSPTGGPYPQSSSYIQFFDHSQKVCFRYQISSGSLQVAKQTVADVAACSATSFGSFSILSSGNVSGTFQITPSSSAPKRVGKVTVSLDVSEDVDHHAYIQTSASLRDYGNVGL